MYHGVLPYTGSYMNVLHAESERCWKMLKVARFGTLSKSVKQDQTSASQVSPSEAPYSNWLDVAAACGLAWRCMEHLPNFIIVSKGSNSEKTHGFRIYRISEKIRSCMTLQTVTFITWGCIKLCDLPCRLIQPVRLRPWWPRVQLLSRSILSWWCERETRTAKGNPEKMEKMSCLMIVDIYAMMYMVPSKTARSHLSPNRQASTIFHPTFRLSKAKLHGLWMERAEKKTLNFSGAFTCFDMLCAFWCINWNAEEPQRILSGMAGTRPIQASSRCFRLLLLTPYYVVLAECGSTLGQANLYDLVSTVQRWTSFFHLFGNIFYINCFNFIPPFALVSRTECHHTVSSSKCLTPSGKWSCWICRKLRSIVRHRTS